MLTKTAFAPGTIGSPSAAPRRGPEHERLSACIGVWKTTGTLEANAVPMNCTERYDWVPGQFFIAYHFDRQIGPNTHRGTGLIGYDPSREGYFAYFVDNAGYARSYQLEIEGSEWKFSGQWERATLTFEPRRMRAHWEHSKDGTTWRTLCDFSGGRSG